MHELSEIVSLKEPVEFALDASIPVALIVVIVKVLMNWLSMIMYIPVWSSLPRNHIKMKGLLNSKCDEAQFVNTGERKNLEVSLLSKNTYIVILYNFNQ